MVNREAFQSAVDKPDLSVLGEAVLRAKRGEWQGRETMAAAMAWAAFACPDATNAIYDQLAHAWLGQGSVSDYPHDLPEAPLEASFWEAFWAVVDGAEAGYDATSITVAVASLGAAVHPGMEQIAEDFARRHPGAAAALVRPVPGHTDLEALGRLPADSPSVSVPLFRWSPGSQAPRS